MPLLDTPRVLQSTDFSCADAAVQCVLRFHRIAAAPRIGTPPDGADPREIESAFRKLHLRVVSGEMRLEDLAYYCRTDRPPIVLVHWPEDPCSHYAVVRGVSPAQSFVYYHDVWDGRSRRTAEDFLAAWKGRGRLNEAFRCWAVVGWPALSC
jgi:ABC-type bacteriocin/lantibiotic exporter with double-glycine peptidase domain